MAIKRENGEKRLKPESTRRDEEVGEKPYSGLIKFNQALQLDYYRT